MRSGPASTPTATLAVVLAVAVAGFAGWIVPAGAVRTLGPGRKVALRSSGYGESDREASTTESEESDDDEDLFLHSAFATHKARVSLEGDEEEPDADDELFYHIRSGAVRIKDGVFELSSKEEAKATADRIAPRAEEDEDEDSSDDDDSDEESEESDDYNQEDTEEEVEEPVEHVEKARATIARRDWAASTDESSGFDDDDDDEIDVATGAHIPPQQAHGFDPMQVTSHLFGDYGSPRQRRFFKHTALGPISPWHDIPLTTEAHGLDTLMMVTSVPALTAEQQRLATEEKMNPIVAKIKDEAALKYGEAMLWNYGFLPQTWADPDSINPELGLRGASGPIHVVEVGSRQHARGQVTRVRPLGALPMVDGDALRWLVIAVDVDDPVSSQLKAVHETEPWDAELSGSLRQWFGRNEVADGVVLHLVPRDRALRTVSEAHRSWERLRRGDVVHNNIWAGFHYQQHLHPHPHAQVPPHMQHLLMMQQQQQQQLPYLQQPPPPIMTPQQQFLHQQQFLQHQQFLMQQQQRMQQQQQFQQYQMQMQGQGPPPPVQPPPQPPQVAEMKPLEEEVPEKEEEERYPQRRDRGSMFRNRPVDVDMGSSRPRRQYGSAFSGSSRRDGYRERRQYGDDRGRYGRQGSWDRRPRGSGGSGSGGSGSSGYGGSSSSSGGYGEPQRMYGTWKYEDKKHELNRMEELERKYGRRSEKPFEEYDDKPLEPFYGLADDYDDVPQDAAPPPGLGGPDDRERRVKSKGRSQALRMLLEDAREPVRVRERVPFRPSS